MCLRQVWTQSTPVSTMKMQLIKFRIYIILVKTHTTTEFPVGAVSWETHYVHPEPDPT